MTSLKRQIRRACAVVLAAGIGVWVAGCGSMPDMAAGPLDSIRALPFRISSKADDEAFRKQVENDPFPAAGVTPPPPAESSRTARYTHSNGG